MAQQPQQARPTGTKTSSRTNIDARSNALHPNPAAYHRGPSGFPSSSSASSSSGSAASAHHQHPAARAASQSPYATAEPHLARLLSDHHSLRLQLKDLEGKLALTNLPPHQPTKVDPELVASQVETYLQSHLQPVLQTVVKGLITEPEPPVTSPPASPAPSTASAAASSIQSSLPASSAMSSGYQTPAAPGGGYHHPGAGGAPKSLGELYASVGRIHGDMITAINSLSSDPSQLQRILQLEGELQRIQYVETPQLAPHEQQQLVSFMQMMSNQRQEAMKQPRPAPVQQPPTQYASPQHQQQQHSAVYSQKFQTSTPPLDHQNPPLAQTGASSSSLPPRSQQPPQLQPIDQSMYGGGPANPPLISPSHFTAAPAASSPPVKMEVSQSDPDDPVSRLEAMGFTNRALNEHLLRFHGGKFGAVVDVLLTMQHAQPQPPSQYASPSHAAAAASYPYSNPVKSEYPSATQPPQSQPIVKQEQHSAAGHYGGAGYPMYTSAASPGLYAGGSYLQQPSQQPYSSGTAASASASSSSNQPQYSYTIDRNSKLAILEVCGFKPFDFTYRTSAVNHIKSLLRDKVKISAAQLANDVWHFESRYNLQGIQEWRARVRWDGGDGKPFEGPWTDWHLVKTQATEESAEKCLHQVQRTTEWKWLFLRPLPTRDDPNPISAVRNYLRDRSIWKDRLLEETVSIRHDQYHCKLMWGGDCIGEGGGSDKVLAKTAASTDALRRWDDAMNYLKQKPYHELQQFQWLELP